LLQGCINYTVPPCGLTQLSFNVDYTAKLISPAAPEWSSQSFNKSTHSKCTSLWYWRLCYSLLQRI